MSYVIVVAVSEYWDDGVHKVIGPFMNKEAAERFNTVVYANGQEDNATQIIPVVYASQVKEL